MPLLPRTDRRTPKSPFFAASSASSSSSSSACVTVLSVLPFEPLRRVRARLPGSSLVSSTTVTSTPRVLGGGGRAGGARPSERTLGAGPVLSPVPVLPRIADGETASKELQGLLEVSPEILDVLETGAQAQQ